MKNFEKMRKKIIYTHKFNIKYSFKLKQVLYLVIVNYELYYCQYVEISAEM